MTSCELRLATRCSLSHLNFFFLHSGKAKVGHHQQLHGWVADGGQGPQAARQPLSNRTPPTERPQAGLDDCSSSCQPPGRPGQPAAPVDFSNDGRKNLRDFDNSSTPSRGQSARSTPQPADNPPFFSIPSIGSSVPPPCPSPAGTQPSAALVSSAPAAPPRSAPRAPSSSSSA